ncbi:hypothetical protein [Methylobacterium sp. DCY52]|jgi:hypothetical protein|uniref:hypothetical protein n=1 Tax=Methylobacterium sp. DCY52 TaxID=739139 RepID=UPI00314512AB
MALVMMVVMLVHDRMIVVMLVLVYDLMVVIVMVAVNPNPARPDVNVLCGGCDRREGQGGSSECGKRQLHFLSPETLYRLKHTNL